MWRSNIHHLTPEFCINSEISNFWSSIEVDHSSMKYEKNFRKQSRFGHPVILTFLETIKGTTRGLQGSEKKGEE